MSALLPEGARGDPGGRCRPRYRRLDEPNDASFAQRCQWYLASCASDQGAARSPDASRPYPDDEWRQLSAHAVVGPTPSLGVQSTLSVSATRRSTSPTAIRRGRLPKTRSTAATSTGWKSRPSGGRGHSMATARCCGWSPRRAPATASSRSCGTPRRASGRRARSVGGRRCSSRPTWRVQPAVPIRSRRRAGRLACGLVVEHKPHFLATELQLGADHEADRARVIGCCRGS